jgi:hypothetical protein
MEFSPTPVFYVFIGLMIGMVIGWVIGFFDSNSRTSKKIEAAEIKMKEAERKIAEAEQNPQLSQTRQDDPALLRLKKNDGRFTLEMDGAFVTGNLMVDNLHRPHPSPPRRFRRRPCLILFKLQFLVLCSLPPNPYPRPRNLKRKKISRR